MFLRFRSTLHAPCASGFGFPPQGSPVEKKSIICYKFVFLFSIALSFDSEKYHRLYYLVELAINEDFLEITGMEKDYLDFDISVSAAKKKKNTSRKSYPGEEEGSQKPCHIVGCNRMGKYKAPASPDNLKEFIWFCKEHITTYNTQWNYYEQKIKNTNDDFVMGDESGDSQFQWSNFKVNDPFDFVEEDSRNHHSFHASTTIRLSKTEQRASEILDLEGNFSKSDARKRYRVLVKDLHPDMNNGNRSDEDRLKEVVWAWDQIKRSRKIPDP